jgi:hypothetical protein
MKLQVLNYNQSWLSGLHSYLIEEWFQISIFIPFERVIERANSINLVIIVDY